MCIIRPDPLVFTQVLADRDIAHVQGYEPEETVVNSSLFAGYLACPTKCFLRFCGEVSTQNPIADWIVRRNDAYYGTGVGRLCGRSQFVFNQVFRTQSLEAQIQVVEYVGLKGRSVEAVPIHFVSANKLSRANRLLAVFEALVLSKAQRTSVRRAKIIHGDNWSTITIKTSPLFREVGRVIDKIADLLSKSAPPDLVLNRHCPECEFLGRCRTMALEKNHLSLLSGMRDGERTRLNAKGIFTVNQLSYTFRPRRRPKRFAARPEKYHDSLKALAIRESKIHVIGDPQLRIDGTPVFLDVEGIPDRDFYYLIGIRVERNETVIRHHFWADGATDEEIAWRSFLAVLSAIESPVLLHYGSFETIFLKKMRDRYGGPPEGSAAARAIASSINLVTIIFARVYFPTYSNGLKEIGRLLGFEWTDPSSSGLQSLVWRHEWEATREPAIQQKLITYNADDCEALSFVARSLRAITKSTTAGEGADSFGLVRVESLRKTLSSKWRRFESPIADLVQINDAAHWSYQRDRVFVRSRDFRRKPPRQSKKARSIRCPKTQIVLKGPELCPECGEKWRRKRRPQCRIVLDLVFGKSSVKLRMVEYVFRACFCIICRYEYGPHQWYGRGHARKWGWNILAWVVYSAVGLRIPQPTVQHSLKGMFGLDMNRSVLNYLKSTASEFYSVSRQRILDRIVTGDLIHADETQANIKGHLAYVWVFTSLRDVVYILAESREGEFVQRLLKDFKGVLVSDFYAVYDAIDCRQQKCLIHLMRDLNDEMLNNPFDEEFKSIVLSFARLLKPIVETIDQHGLRRHFLRKHSVTVDRFYRFLNGSSFKSDAASKCKQRFLKNRDKLFTFLGCDGVAWHNNNAEHAIKAFAKLRHVISGTSNKKGLEEYLILLSVAETCEYRGLDFLAFLKSGERDVEAFARRRRCQRRSADFGSGTSSVESKADSIAPSAAD